MLVYDNPLERAAQDYLIEQLSQDQPVVLKEGEHVQDHTYTALEILRMARQDREAVFGESYPSY